MVETQLAEIAHGQGGCERIKTTPLRFAYSSPPPFALAPTLGWWALPVVLQPERYRPA